MFNYPCNYFYIQIHGEEKNETDKENVFIVDNRMVQILSVETSKFLNLNEQGLSSVEILKKYIDWEEKYIAKIYSVNVISETKYMKTRKGNDFALWVYDMPIKKEVITKDSTITHPVQKQMFAIMLIKNYIIGTNTPLIHEHTFDELKRFLIANMEGIVESDTRIDIDELNQKLSK